MQRRFDHIRWTPGRIDHVARHGVSREEADDALHDPRGTLRRAGAGRYTLYGRSEAGRPLMLVLVDEGERIAGIVTGRGASDAERRTYFGRG